jgi:hypothetical protein
LQAAVWFPSGQFSQSELSALGLFPGPQLPHVVAVPPGLVCPEGHCVQVAFVWLLLAIIQPAFAVTAYVDAGHAVPLYDTWLDVTVAQPVIAFWGAV